MSFLKKWESLTLLLLRCGLGLVFIYHGYPKLIPKHPMADAVDYTLGQWEALTVFTSDGTVPIDNNVSEREMKRVVLNRNYVQFRIMRSAAVKSEIVSLFR